jgi:hypothetical protein
MQDATIGCRFSQKGEDRNCLQSISEKSLTNSSWKTKDLLESIADILSTKTGKINGNIFLQFIPELRNIFQPRSAALLLCI